MFFLGCEEKGVIEESTVIKNENFYNARIQEDSLNSEYWNQFGDYYLQNNYLLKACQCFEKSFILDSSNFDLSFKLSEVYFKQLALQKSQRYLKSCVRIDSTKTQPYLNLAQLFIFKSDYSAAFKFINLGLTKNRYLPQGYFMKGVCYKHIKDTTKALSSFKTAIEIDPNYFAAYPEIGLLLTIQRDSNAIYYYKNALNISHQNIDAWFGLCWSYQSFNKTELALKEYDRFILVYPDYVIAKFNLGLIYLERRELEKAKYLFYQIHEAHPENIDVLINLYKCFEIEGNKIKTAEIRSDISEIDSTYFN